METTDTIVTYGNDVLRAPAEEIGEFNDEIEDLIERMYEIMADSRGLGLAGPQIGLAKRIFVYDVGEGQHAMINPEIVSSSGEEPGFEGCLSIPGLHGEVPRATNVTIMGINEEGKKVKIEATDLLARVFQHEMDHLDGMLFIDRADPETIETIPVEAEQESSRI